MISAEQGEIIVELVRKNARMLRRERVKPLRLVNAFVAALEAQVPEEYLLPFSSSLRKTLDDTHFEESALPSAVRSLFNKNHLCMTENLGALESFGARIRSEFGVATEDAVLVGEGAALAALYRDPGAFPGRHWVALLQNGICANGDRPKALRPPEVGWTEKIQFGNGVWRNPKPELLIALFASHVGDPATSPTPPMWPHLGLALLAWKDRVGVDEVLALGIKLAQRNEVERGLAIIAHIFPELESWIKPEKLHIPAWERKFAVPIAARRIVMGERQ